MGWVQSILWGETRRVRDASGAWRELLDPASQSQLSSNHLDPQTMTSVRRRALMLTLANRRREGLLGEGTVKGRWSLVVAAVPIVVWMPIFVHSMFPSTGVARFVYSTLALLVTGLIAWLIYRYSNMAEPRHTARAYLSRSRCPACGYNLAQIARDERGTTTCPECGASWAKRGR